MHAKHFALLSLIAGALAIPMPQPDGSSGSMDGKACAMSGQIVCSDDGMVVYQCVWKTLKKLAAAPTGTKCVNGMLVNANSSAPPPPMNGGSPPMSGSSPPMSGGSPPMSGGSPPMAPPPPMNAGSPPMAGGSSAMNGGNYGSGGSDSKSSPTTTIMITETARATSTQVTVVTQTGSAPGNKTPSGEADNLSGDPSITEQQVLAAAPESKSCADTTECVTADVAAKAMSESFAKYDIRTLGEKAALLSLIILESGSFKYKTNKHPGRPGQGTRNMMMPEFIYDYAKDVDAAALAKAAPGINSGAELQEGKNATKVAVLDIVNKSDDLSFGSAAWFLTAKCDKDIRENLKKGDEASWTKYMTDCIHVPPQLDERKAGWQKALSALMGK